jgi:thiamine biosynthesis lipoprotein
MASGMAAPKGPSPGPEPPDLACPAGMRRVRFGAMGTTVSVLLPERQAEVGSAAVRDLFVRWEGTLSRFLPQSELASLNRHAGQPVAVSPLLYEVIATALKAAQATDGLYDPTLLRQLMAVGYERSFATLAPQLPAAAGLPGPGGGWRRIAVDHRHRSVTLPAGVGLDLGGIAKGMAVDAAVSCLRTLGADAALVNAGGDLAVHGCLPGGTAWPVMVEGRAAPQVVLLQRGALATSGIARRHWQQGQQGRHHLLDPRTGLPAQSGLWAVTVVAARCVQAEVAATAAFVLGPEEGARFLQVRGLAGWLAREDGLRQAVGAWPAPLEDA